jgi:hypothetical protein
MVVVAVVILSAASTTQASATVWNEVGDAGDLPAAAQVPHGSGTLTAIAGSLLLNGDADLYLIHIDDPATFAASTCNGIADTQLWLFAPDGDGVTFDDDDPECGVLSRITGAHVPATGLYYLGCSAYDWDALDAEGQPIWLDAPYDVERTPDGPGAPGPVAAWGGTGYEAGAYAIELEGVSWAVVGVADLPAPLADAARLDRAFPNPFGEATAIRYVLPLPASVTLSVYDAQGRFVRRLVDARTEPGMHQAKWDGNDQGGRAAPAGIYYVRLAAGGRAESQTVVRVR